MRILSQDGKFDFPYERVCLEVSDSGKVFAQGNIWGTEDNYIEVAKYESEAKARKAMDMLHGAFENYDWIKSTGNSEELKQVARMLSHDDFKKMTTSYFKFPSDDEVEV